MGPQGSGKSTQAKMLAEKFGLCFISSGDLLREKAKEDSDEGRLIKLQMNQGILVDDSILAQLIENKVNECGGKFVMDGYPRRMSQIDAYDPNLKKVFILKVSDEEILKRLLARGRFDDTEENIKKRLEWHHKETQPVIEYYKNQGILVEINGLGTVEEIARQIMAHLKKV